MAFQFAQSDKTVERAVRRIAAEEVTEACAALDDTTLPLDARIHEARKAVKKLRGLIRLVRPGLDRYAAENAALRAAGRSIAGLREAEVTQRTLSAIAGGATLSTDDSDALARPIVDRHAEEHAALDEATAAFRAAMEALAGRAASWRVEGKEFDALEAGLARTWADAGKAMKRALKRRSEDDFHDWRKRAKDHWYQARLLAPIWPAMMDPHVAAADRLGEALGEANDLSVLIRDLARGDTAEATRARLVEEAGRRRDILLAEAEILGRRLFAGPPEALTARWQVWWQVWRGKGFSAGSRQGETPPQAPPSPLWGGMGGGRFDRGGPIPSHGEGAAPPGRRGRSDPRRFRPQAAASSPFSALSISAIVSVTP